MTTETLEHNLRYINTFKVYQCGKCGMWYYNRKEYRNHFKDKCIM